MERAVSDIELISPKPKRFPCKGCGKMIVWGLNEDGKAIPLDPAPAIYGVVVDREKVMAVRDRHAMVSHFSTCPKATNFSKKP